MSENEKRIEMRKATDRIITITDKDGKILCKDGVFTDEIKKRKIPKKIAKHLKDEELQVGKRIP